MKITDVNVYELEESIVASGYPMTTGEVTLNTESRRSQANWKRMIKLGKAKQGSGHDCALKGILVSMNVTAPQYWWMQAERYTWFNFVSSQSKMHMLLKMNLEQQCNDYVTDIAIMNLRICLDGYANGMFSFDTVLSNVPMGLELTARITTNYLQLKTMYHQRRDHRSSEWQSFCNWVEQLPLFKEIVL